MHRRRFRHFQRCRVDRKVSIEAMLQIRVIRCPMRRIAKAIGEVPELLS